MRLVLPDGTILELVARNVEISQPWGPVIIQHADLPRVIEFLRKAEAGR